MQLFLSELLKPCSQLLYSFKSDLFLTFIVEMKMIKNQTTERPSFIQVSFNLTFISFMLRVPMHRDVHGL